MRVHVHPRIKERTRQQANALTTLAGQVMGKIFGVVRRGHAGHIARIGIRSPRLFRAVCPTKKREGANPKFVPPLKGWYTPYRKQRTRGTRPVDASPRKCRFLYAEKYQFSAETAIAMNAKRAMSGALRPPASMSGHDGLACLGMSLSDGMVHNIVLNIQRDAPLRRRRQKSGRCPRCGAHFLEHFSEVNEMAFGAPCRSASEWSSGRHRNSNE